MLLRYLLIPGLAVLIVIWLYQRFRNWYAIRKQINQFYQGTEKQPKDLWEDVAYRTWSWSEKDLGADLTFEGEAADPAFRKSTRVALQKALAALDMNYVPDLLRQLAAAYLPKDAFFLFLQETGLKWPFLTSGHNYLRRRERQRLKEIVGILAEVDILHRNMPLDMKPLYKIMRGDQATKTEATVEKARLIVRIVQIASRQEKFAFYPHQTYARKIQNQSYKDWSNFRDQRLAVMARQAEKIWQLEKEFSHKYHEAQQAAQWIQVNRSEQWDRTLRSKIAAGFVGLAKANKFLAQRPLKDVSRAVALVQQSVTELWALIKEIEQRGLGPQKSYRTRPYKDNRYYAGLLGLGSRANLSDIKQKYRQCIQRSFHAHGKAAEQDEKQRIASKLFSFYEAYQELCGSLQNSAR